MVFIFHDTRRKTVFKYDNSVKSKHSTSYHIVYSVQLFLIYYYTNFEFIIKIESAVITNILYLIKHRHGADVEKTYYDIHIQLGIPVQRNALFFCV